MSAWTIEDLQIRLSELTGETGEPEVSALRRRILDIATDQFVRFGYRRANVGEIARAAGIGKGSLYLHFNSKETLLIAAISLEKMALIPEIGRILQLPPEQQLEAYLRMALRFILNAKLSSRVVRGDPEIDRFVQKYRGEHDDDTQKGRELIGSLIAGAAPGLSDGQRTELSLLIESVLPLTAHLGAGTPLALPADVFIDRYARVLALGIRALDP